MGRQKILGRVPGASLAFALVHQSTNTGLTKAILQSIADACEAQLDNELAAEWGGRYLVRVVMPDDAPPVDTEVAVYLQDALPDPNVLGYHDIIRATGMPVAYIATAGVTDFTGSASALSVTISHELCETAADPSASRWVDNGKGRLIALEICDEVEDTAYKSPNGVFVSNFLFQSYFAPGSVGPYDKLGILTQQDQETSGGYTIFAPAPTDIQNGRLRDGGGHPAYVSRQPSKNLAKKAHITSRTARRGVTIKL